MPRLFWACFAMGVLGQQCSCNFCTDSESVSAGATYSLHLSSPCRTGTTAVVTELNVKTTDDSTFDVFTQRTLVSTTYYVAGSESSVTCFKKAGANVGGEDNDIFVLLRCRNSVFSCPFIYTITLACTASTVVAPTNAVTPTNAVAPTPNVSPSNAPLRDGMPGVLTAWTYDTNCMEATATLCVCSCCAGIGCSSNYVGVVNGGTCSPSDCRTAFPQSCPDTNGVVGASSGSKSKSAMKFPDNSCQPWNSGYSFSVQCFGSLASSRWKAILYAGPTCNAQLTQFDGSGTSCNPLSLQLVPGGLSFKVDCSGVPQLAISLLILVLPFAFF